MKDFKVDDFDFEEEYSKVKKNIKKPNILICGATGVGKSSIVNEIFGESIAKVGDGVPVTRGIKEYKKDDLDIVLYDSEGYEVGDEKLSKFKENVIGLIDKKRKETASVEKHIHLVWYCISAGNKRITDLDIETIKAIQEKDVKVSILLTQIDAVDEDELNNMIKVINDTLVDIPYFRLSIYKEEVPKEYLDWEALIDWSMDNLDDVLKDAFVRALDIGLDEKRKLVNKRIIPRYTVLASGVALSPIPFSDSALIIPVQMAMTMNILNIYKIDKLGKSVESLVSSMVISALGKNVSKMLLANLIKLMPGVGTAAGIAINATVASAFTASIGYSISELCYRYSKAIFEGEDLDIVDVFTNQNMSDLFDEFFKMKKAE